MLVASDQRHSILLVRSLESLGTILEKDLQPGLRKRTTLALNPTLPLSPLS
jgi:hypothetical protein